MKPTMTGAGILIALGAVTIRSVNVVVIKIGWPARLAMLFFG